MAKIPAFLWLTSTGRCTKTGLQATKIGYNWLNLSMWAKLGCKLALAAMGGSRFTVKVFRIDT